MLKKWGYVEGRLVECSVSNNVRESASKRLSSGIRAISRRRWIIEWNRLPVE